MLGTFDSPSLLGIVLATVVGVGAVVIHVCLTRRNPWWLGAIMPVAWVSGQSASQRPGAQRWPTCAMT